MFEIISYTMITIIDRKTKTKIKFILAPPEHLIIIVYWREKTERYFMLRRTLFLPSVYIVA